MRGWRRGSRSRRRRSRRRARPAQAAGTGARVAPPDDARAGRRAARADRVPGRSPPGTRGIRARPGGGAGHRGVHHANRGGVDCLVLAAAAAARAGRASRLGRPRDPRRSRRSRSWSDSSWRSTRGHVVALRGHPEKAARRRATAGAGCGGSGASREAVPRLAMKANGPDLPGHLLGASQDAWVRSSWPSPRSRRCRRCACAARPCARRAWRGTCSRPSSSPPCVPARPCSRSRRACWWA